MPKGKGKGVMGKGPGDAKQKPRVPSWRGDKGSSAAKGPGEGKSVEYSR